MARIRLDEGAVLKTVAANHRWEFESLTRRQYVELAQLVEHCVANAEVARSSLVFYSNFARCTKNLLFA